MFRSRSNVSLVAAGIFGAALALTSAQALTACTSSHSRHQGHSSKSSAEAKEEKEEEEGDEAEESEQGEKGEKGEKGGGEEQIDISKAPEAVRAAAQKHFANLGSCKASRENDHGATVYEIVGKGSEGMDLSLNITSSGSIFEVERETKAEALPAEVRATLSKKFGDATLNKAEVVEEHYYEVGMTKNGKKFEVKLSATGQVKGGKD